MIPKAITQALSKAKGAVTSILNSHSVLHTTIATTKVIANPFKTISFAVLIQQAKEELKPADPTDPGLGSFDVSELNLIRICASFSSSIYYPKEERTLPTEIGGILFEPDMTNLSHGVPIIVTNSDVMNMIFVGCRGSYCFKDFITDLNANACNVYGGLMHDGVFKSSVIVYETIKDFLIRLSKDNNNRPIVVTGHSLGGAVASAVVGKFKRDFPDFPIYAIVFAPAASVSRNLWEQSRHYCSTFVVSNDAVPFLSFHNIAAISSRFLPDGAADFIHEKLVRESQICPVDYDVQAVMTAGNPFENEQPSIEDIKNDLKTDDFLISTELFPPGELYLYELSGIILKKVDLRKIRSCNYFGRFVLGLEEDSSNHSMCIYKECAEEVLKQKKQTEE